MSLVAHPYILGAPHRLRYLAEAIAHIRRRNGVAFWTGERMLDPYRAERPDTA